ncbi:type II secretion system protein [Serratia sp. AKBS12]|uniref:type II secretion system protein n=1 Tax=Serratia sp. AKBS12 TaxID=2974597 RepID=UPI002165AD1F|nr:type II secretion system protein [Serratia sp. AKBS12]MCS3407104.1 type II secretion system GspH family protein [Serratia sp. AKBS12]HEI8868867.1 type II secretion system protein [Serratia odorifera]
MRGQQGFTLIEMMVTLALLATLAAAAIPLVQRQQQQQQEETLRESLRQIRDAIDRYAQASQEGKIEQEAGESAYPESLDKLVKGVADKTSPDKKMIYFLRRIPRDPFCDCEGRSDAETWRTRSSIQEPGDFTGGKDVFDVSSRSAKTGLNGIPYAQW